MSGAAAVVQHGGLTALLFAFTMWSPSLAAVDPPVERGGTVSHSIVVQGLPVPLPAGSWQVIAGPNGDGSPEKVILARRSPEQPAAVQIESMTLAGFVRDGKQLPVFAGNLTADCAPSRWLHLPNSPLATFGSPAEGTPVFDCGYLYVGARSIAGSPTDDRTSSDPPLTVRFSVAAPNRSVTVTADFSVPARLLRDRPLSDWTPAALAGDFDATTYLKRLTDWGSAWRDAIAAVQRGRAAPELGGGPE